MGKIIFSVSVLGVVNDKLLIWKKRKELKNVWAKV